MEESATESTGDPPADTMTSLPAGIEEAYWDLLGPIMSSSDRKSRILLVGAQFANVDNIYQLGYRNIICTDSNDEVIKAMLKKHMVADREKFMNIKWRVLPSKSERLLPSNMCIGVTHVIQPVLFDIVIDNGTINDLSSKAEVKEYIQQLMKLLSTVKGAKFICFINDCDASNTEMIVGMFLEAFTMGMKLTFRQLAESQVVMMLIEKVEIFLNSIITNETKNQILAKMIRVDGDDLRNHELLSKGFNEPYVGMHRTDDGHTYHILLIKTDKPKEYDYLWQTLYVYDESLVSDPKKAMDAVLRYPLAPRICVVFLSFGDYLFEKQYLDKDLQRNFEKFAGVKSNKTPCYWSRKVTADELLNWNESSVCEFEKVELLDDRKAMELKKDTLVSELTQEDVTEIYEEPTAPQIPKQEECSLEASPIKIPMLVTLNSKMNCFGETVYVEGPPINGSLVEWSNPSPLSVEELQKICNGKENLLSVFNCTKVGELEIPYLICEAVLTPSEYFQNKWLGKNHSIANVRSWWQSIRTTFINYFRDTVRTIHFLLHNKWKGPKLVGLEFYITSEEESARILPVFAAEVGRSVTNDILSLMNSLMFLPFGGRSDEHRKDLPEEIDYMLSFLGSCLRNKGDPVPVLYILDCPALWSIQEKIDFIFKVRVLSLKSRGFHKLLNHVMSNLYPKPFDNLENDVLRTVYEPGALDKVHKTAENMNLITTVNAVRVEPYAKPIDLIRFLAAVYRHGKIEGCSNEARPFELEKIINKEFPELLWNLYKGIHDKFSEGWLEANELLHLLHVSIEEPVFK